MTLAVQLKVAAIILISFTALGFNVLVTLATVRWSTPDCDPSPVIRQLDRENAKLRINLNDAGDCYNDLSDISIQLYEERNYLYEMLGDCYHKYEACQFYQYKRDREEGKLPKVDGF